MFKKSIITAMAITVLASATALSGTNAAFAGGHGHGHKHGHHHRHGHGHGFGHGHHYNNRLIIKVPGGVSWGKHVSWCYNRYRSYRKGDNSFKPYHGPRRQCRSPFFHG